MPFHTQGDFESDEARPPNAGIASAQRRLGSPYLQGTCGSTRRLREKRRNPGDHHGRYTTFCARCDRELKTAVLDLAQSVESVLSLAGRQGRVRRRQRPPQDRTVTRLPREGCGGMAVVYLTVIVGLESLLKQINANGATKVSR